MQLVSQLEAPGPIQAKSEVASLMEKGMKRGTQLKQGGLVPIALKHLVQPLQDNADFSMSHELRERLKQYSWAN